MTGDEFQQKYGYLFKSYADPVTGELTYSGPSNQELYDKYMAPADKSIGGYEAAHGMDEGGLNIYGGQGILAGTRAPGLSDVASRALGLPSTPAGQSNFGAFTGFGNQNAAGGTIIDPSKKFLDPNYGWVTADANYRQPARDWTSWGYPLMMAIAGAGMGSAIGAVGGGSGFFGASNLISGVPKAGSALDSLSQLFGSNQQAPSGGSAPGTATPNNANMNPLLAILALLSRFGKKG